MHLKEIEIKGFKSFANKIKLSITPGITVIVGPNGCGKSNITDAVRWILGEQNIHSLRGEKMTDMIFSGNSDQKIRNIAEVSMIFDNTDHKLSIDSEEVELKRIIFRSGETENYINGMPCKLRDIHELFWGTGIGKNAYSIIAQGKVDFVLNAKPVERRVLFEEAANISSYNIKKDNALKKLGLVENNLLRINDIFMEVKESLSHYKLQADNLKLYRLYHEHIRELDFYLLSQQYLLYKKNLNQNEETLSTIKNEILAIEKIVMDSKRKMIQIETEKEQYELELNNSEILLQESDRNKNSLNNQLILLKQKGLDMNQRIINLKNDVEHAGHQFNTFQETLSDIDRDIQETRSNSKILQENDNNKTVLLNKYNHIFEYLQQEANKSESGKGELSYHRFSRYREETIKKETVLNSLKVTLLEMEKEIQNIQNELSRNQNRITNIEKNLVYYEREIKHFQEEKVKIDRLLTSNTGLMNQQTDKIRNDENNIILKNKEKDFLEELRKSNQVKKMILKDHIPDKNLLQEIHWFGKMYDLIEDIPDRIKNAISMILYDEIQLIRVGHFDQIPNILKHLNSEDLPQMKFIADNIIARKNSEIKKGMPDFKQNKKILGFAHQLISSPPEYNSLFQFLLGDILIVEDMYTALSLFEESKEQFAILTLDGMVIDARGIITSNIPLKNNTDKYPVSIKKINQLEQEIQEIQSQMNQNQSDLEKQKNEHQNLRHKTDSIDRQLESLIMRLHEEKNQEVDINKRNIDLKNQLDMFNQRKKLREDEKKDLENKIATLRLNFKWIEEYVISCNSYSHCISRFKTVCLDTIEKIRKELENVKMKLVWNKDREKLLQKRMEEMNHFIQNYQQEEGARQTKLSESKKELTQLSKQEEMVKEKIKMIMESRKKIHQNKINYQEALQTHNTILRKMRENIENNQKQMEERRNIFHECEMNHVQNQEKLNNLLYSIKNQYTTSIEEILSYENASKNQREASGKIAHYKEQISRMGQINFDALQEYEKQSIRYNELCNKKEEIIESKENLISLIHEIDQVAEEHLLQTFIKIDHYFQEIFQKLFRGGQVSLELTNGKKLLETGIEVMVQPPGKKVQNISLLSTGEKALTAIALLFAMWKVNPSPFCFFDEIDSALDEANALRLASFIKNEDLKEAQIIIITHQKEVMEAADALYGITMEGSGISKLMSVKMLDSGEWQN